MKYLSLFKHVEREPFVSLEAPAGYARDFNLLWQTQSLAKINAQAQLAQLNSKRLKRKGFIQFKLLDLWAFHWLQNTIHLQIDWSLNCDLNLYTLENVLWNNFIFKQPWGITQKLQWTSQPHNLFTENITSDNPVLTKSTGGARRVFRVTRHHHKSLVVVEKKFSCNVNTTFAR